MNVFFYGLFMDATLLKQKGIEPLNPRKGYLKDYELKIGSRASLIPCKNEHSYGIVMTLKEDEVASLYEEPGVADYLPEEVQIRLENGMVINAVCYNLPTDALKGTNQAYAKSLYKLAGDKGFPETYLEKIRQYWKG